MLQIVKIEPRPTTAGQTEVFAFDVFVKTETSEYQIIVQAGDLIHRDQFAELVLYRTGRLPMLGTAEAWLSEVRRHLASYWRWQGEGFKEEPPK